MGKHPPFVKLVWNAQADALLGNQSDRSIAKLLDVHPETVQARRRELGIPPWQQPKRVHLRNCIYCGQAFEIVAGRADRLRSTCPAPKDCETRQRLKKLALASPANQLKRVQGLLERHVRTDK